MSEAVHNFIRTYVGIKNVPSVQVSDIGPQAAINAGSSAFGLALDRRFPDDATVDDARQFIARVRGVWINPEKLNPVLAERVLLDGLDVGGLIDDVSLQETTMAQRMLTYAIVNDLGITGPALEQFAAEAFEQLKELEED